MDRKYVYIFVRKDLSYPQIVVQAAHAVLDATRKFISDDDRYKIVCIGVKSLPRLERVVEVLTANSIKYAEFCETDLNGQKTAIATEPLMGEKRNVLSRYKLLSEN